jgi:hypothetical protein
MNVSAHGRGIGFRCALSLTATALAVESKSAR